MRKEEGIIVSDEVWYRGYHITWTRRERNGARHESAYSA
jgi:hypothetical protein